MNRLLIIGGGAAGLMAAVAAGEAGIPALLLERRHRPGLKLLLCGNNRCNVSHQADAREMLEDYGEPVATFLRKAVESFPPSALRAWFQRAGLQTVVKRDRIYPASENSDDVLHCFLDQMRERQLPMALNCPVSSVSRVDGVFSVACENGLEFTAENVLVATGGFSYPKTGSVGDGQRFASALGHRVLEPRPGLAGVDIGRCPLDCGEDCDIQDAAVMVQANGRIAVKTRGNILCCGSVLRGSAIFDATRAIARKGVQSFEMAADLVPSIAQDALANMLSGSVTPQVLARIGIPGELLPCIGSLLRKLGSGAERAAWLKEFRLPLLGIRPLKEAIVTVGGVDLEEVNPATMESRLLPGLYFAGEVLDIDGPTGGYNLHAAFATARLAVASIAAGGVPRQARCDAARQMERQEDRRDTGRRYAAPPSPKERYGEARATSRGFDRRGKNRGERYFR